MTTKEELHRLIERLSEEEAEDLLDILKLRAEPTTLSAEENAAVREGEAGIARGEYVTLDTLRRELGQ